ncbi:MAG: HEAT repeat domain-containing protein, partial [Chloroflexi bacterium]|nr:HEAT repeat domain-containing protein [Chloroflexota bacterium]
MTNEQSLPEGSVIHQPGWQVGTINQTVVVQSGAATEELTPARLAEVEARYRAQVIERYNRLGFAGLGVGDLRLSDVALDDVFVRLTLTVERTVREPIPLEEWEREDRSRNPFRRGEKKEDDRPRERIITVQEPISLSDALSQHALIVGEPGAGKSTLLRWLAVTFAASSQRGADRLGSQADADRLPLLVELGRLPAAYLQAESRETPNWKLFLPEHLTKQPPFDDIPAPFLAQTLAAGRCLLLCDGLDEIADLSARRRIADSLAEYARSSANRLVLSSRPAGVSGSEGSLGSRFQRLTIQRFTPEDVQRFFGFLYAQNPELTPEEQKKEADALFRAVKAAPKTLELAITPLLAALLLVIWNENAYLPERRVELYERCCQMLIESWEAHHDVAYTGVLRDIGWERHLRLLAPLAYAIHNGGQRTDAEGSELIPVLAQAMQAEGLAAPASATLEAERFLRTLSLRSGLLQFLGGDRYGFPHLTFQEYLTARHIAAQPDPDYIDLVMLHLHKAWWREVHLLAIGHLATDNEGAEKASQLMYMILRIYEPPFQMLRPIALEHRLRRLETLFTKFFPPGKWAQFGARLVFLPKLTLAHLNAGQVVFRRFVTGWYSIDFRIIARTASLHRQPWILLRPIVRDYNITTNTFMWKDGWYELSAFAERFESQLRTILHTWVKCVSQLGLLPQLILNGAAEKSGWQIERRLAWVLAREFTFVATEFSTYISLSTNSNLCRTLTRYAQHLFLRTVLDPGYSEESNAGPLDAAAKCIGQRGELPTDMVTVLVDTLSHKNFQVRKAAFSSLIWLGQGSEEVMSMLVGSLGNSHSDMRSAAASSLSELGKDSEKVLEALVASLVDADSGVRHAAAISLGELGQGSEKVLGALAASLDDADSGVRRAVAS